MRTYEALYIVQPDVADDEVQTVANGVESLITEKGGSIVRSEIWGKRKLAYEVNNCTEGSYVLLRFQSGPEVLEKLTSFFKLSEQIIRNLVVLFDEHTLRLEEEQERKRAEARLAAAENDDNDDDDDRPRRGADDE